MTLSEAVLQKLGSSPSTHRSALSVPDEGAGWSVGITTDRRDEIGCALWEVGLRFTGDEANRADASLTDWAQRVCKSVSGLLESLSVIEIDVVRNEAMLRSGPPSRQNDHVSFYEVMLYGTRSALIRRYAATLDAHERRAQVAFTLTNEVVAKLITDLAGTA